jgi:predicted RNase H-like HicB family nuclease
MQGDLASGWRILVYFKIEFDREQDGRWIAEIPALPGVLVYGDTREEAEIKVEVLAFRVLADRMERNHEKADRVEFAVA